MIASIDPAFVLSNHIEAGLWSVIGIGMAAAAAFQRGVVRRDCIVAAVTFVFFGGRLCRSDDRRVVAAVVAARVESRLRLRVPRPARRYARRRRRATVTRASCRCG
jgi:hypothetical protein